MSPRKPQQQRSIARREQIMAAARRLIGQKGYANLTISELAKEADVSPSSMYQYFKDKTAIMVALQQDSASHFQLALTEVFQQVPTHKEQLADYFLQIMRLNYQMHQSDPVVRDITLAAATNKEIANLEAADLAATMRFLLNQSLSFFPVEQHVAVETMLSVLVHSALATTALALQQQPSHADATMQCGCRLLALGWKDFCQSPKLPNAPTFTQKDPANV